MKYSILFFWNDFDYTNNMFTNNYYKSHEYSNDLENIDFIIVGSFINNYDIVKNLNCKKILYISEPISEYLYYDKTIKLLNENVFDKIIGCINHDPIHNRYKLPLYLMYFNYSDENIFINTNLYVKNCKIPENFGCLINTHDQKNTRSSIYHLLKEIDLITCPSSLFNNTTNEELNKIGNVEYIKKFKYNICSENCISNLEGYITEKLLNCSLGYAIPIYCGWFDDIDEQIFNKNRILFYDPNDNISMNNLYEKIKYFEENKEEFEKFYRQDIFCNNAYQICLDLEENIHNINL
jgi:hypothetical protein